MIYTTTLANCRLLLSDRHLRSRNRLRRCRGDLVDPPGPGQGAFRPPPGKHRADGVGVRRKAVRRLRWRVDGSILSAGRSCTNPLPSTFGRWRKICAPASTTSSAPTCWSTSSRAEPSSPSSTRAPSSTPLPGRPVSTGSTTCGFSRSGTRSGLPPVSYTTSATAPRAASPATLRWTRNWLSSLRKRPRSWRNGSAGSLSGFYDDRITVVDAYGLVTPASWIIVFSGEKVWKEWLDNRLELTTYDIERKVVHTSMGASGTEALAVAHEKVTVGHTLGDANHSADRHVMWTLSKQRRQLAGDQPVLAPAPPQLDATLHNCLPLRAIPPAEQRGSVLQRVFTACLPPSENPSSKKSVASGKSLPWEQLPCACTGQRPPFRGRLRKRNRAEIN